MALIRLDSDRLQVLGISPSWSGAFTFYEFDHGPYTDYHEVVAIGQRSEDSLVLELRLMYIDEELLADWPDGPARNQESVAQPQFDSFNESSGHITPTPDEFDRFIGLLESWTGEPLPSPDDQVGRFRRMRAGELAGVHVKPTNPKAAASWYRYLPDEEVSGADEITLVRLPHWLAHSRYGREQHSRLEFVTFQRDRFKDPSFDPLDTWGLGNIVVNRSGLRELVTLLKRHSFEYMVGASEL